MRKLPQRVRTSTWSSVAWASVDGGEVRGDGHGVPVDADAVPTGVLRREQRPIGPEEEVVEVRRVVGVGDPEAGGERRDVAAQGGASERRARRVPSPRSPRGSRCRGASRRTPRRRTGRRCPRTGCPRGRISANTRRARSPVSWPWVSFRFLNRSRSAITSAKSPPSARRTRALFSRLRRFMRPVRPSVEACICVSAMMRNMPSRFPAWLASTCSEATCSSPSGSAIGRVACTTPTVRPMIDTGTHTAPNGSPPRSRSIGHPSSSSLCGNTWVCARRAATHRSGDVTAHPGLHPSSSASTDTTRSRCAWLLSASNRSTRVGHRDEERTSHRVVRRDLVAGHLERAAESGLELASTRLALHHPALHRRLESDVQAPPLGEHVQAEHQRAADEQGHDADHERGARDAGAGEERGGEGARGESTHDQDADQRTHQAAHAPAYGDTRLGQVGFGDALGS